MYWINLLGANARRVLSNPVGGSGWQVNEVEEGVRGGLLSLIHAGGGSGTEEQVIESVSAFSGSSAPGESVS